MYSKIVWRTVTDESAAPLVRTENTTSAVSSVSPTPLSLPLTRPHFEYCEADAVEADLMCPVCSTLLFEPVTHIPCGRMFCAACLSSCADCPLCRRPLDGASGTQVVKTRYILQKLDEIPVYCPGATVSPFLALPRPLTTLFCQSVERSTNAPLWESIFRVARCRVLVGAELLSLPRIESTT
jgi:hypothetical protein